MLVCWLWFHKFVILFLINILLLWCHKFFIFLRIHFLGWLWTASISSTGTRIRSISFAARIRSVSPLPSLSTSRRWSLSILRISLLCISFHLCHRWWLPTPIISSASRTLILIMCLPIIIISVSCTWISNLILSILFVVMVRIVFTLFTVVRRWTSMVQRWWMLIAITATPGIIAVLAVVICFLWA